MMKKTTSALAIAALLGTGAATAATFQVDDNTTMTIYGGVYFAGSDVEVNETTAAFLDRDGAAADDANDTFEETTENTGNVVSESDIFDNGTTLGFDFEHEMANGLTGFARLEEDGFDMVDGGATTNFTDEAYFGVRGDFGSVQFGRNDSVYDDMISDTFDYQEVFAPTAYGPTRQRALQFTSAESNGLTFALEAGFNGDADESNSEADSVSLAAAVSYDAGIATLTAAYDQRGNDVNTDTGETNSTSDDTKVAVDNPIMGIVASFDLNGITVDLGYQTWEEDDATTGADTYEVDVVSLGGRYNYGPGDIYGVYQQVSEDVTGSTVNSSSDRDEIAVGANYNFGNAYVFVEHIQYDADKDLGDATSIGGGYSW